MPYPDGLVFVGYMLSSNWFPLVVREKLNFTFCFSFGIDIPEKLFTALYTGLSL